MTIIHYGIKGMKWGVKKSRPPGGRTVRPRAHKRMTDADLKRHIDRLSLEKRYRDLDHDVNRTKAEKVLSSIFTSSVTSVGTVQVTAALTAAIVAAKALYNK